MARYKKITHAAKERAYQELCGQIIRHSPMNSEKRKADNEQQEARMAKWREKEKLKAEENKGTADGL